MIYCVGVPEQWRPETDTSLLNKLHPSAPDVYHTPVYRVADRVKSTLLTLLLLFIALV